MDKAALFLCCAVGGCAAPASTAPPTLTSALSTHAPVEGPQAIDIYQRARTFELVGDCTAAQSAYEQYADAVRPFDAKSADMAIAYASACAPHATIDPALSSATAAILARDDARALVLLEGDHARDPWVPYERGVALAGLRRTDDAVKAFDAARDGFAAGSRERAMAVYGKARAYHDALRCGEAMTAYGEYAAIAKPADAEIALSYARDCVRYRW